MDKIAVRGIAFFGHHGHTEEERAAGGRFSVDVEVSLDLSKPAKTDHLAETLDYRRIFEIALEVGEKGQFHLIEALAGAVIDRVLAEFPQVLEVSVTVRKYDPRMPGTVDHVACTLSRRR